MFEEIAAAGENAADRNLASGTVRRIAAYFNEVMSEVGEGEELSIEAILLDGDRIRVSYLGFHDPNLILVQGHDRNDKKVDVMMHHHHIQLFIQMSKSTTEKPKMQVGFQK